MTVPTATLTSQQEAVRQRSEVEGVLLVSDIAFRGRVVTAIFTGTGSGSTEVGATLAPSIIWKGVIGTQVDIMLPPKSPVTGCDLVFGTRPPLVDVAFFPDIEYLVYARMIGPDKYEALPRTTSIYAANQDLPILGPGSPVAGNAPIPTGTPLATVTALSSPTTVAEYMTANDSLWRPFLVLGGIIAACVLTGTAFIRKRRIRTKI